MNTKRFAWILIVVAFGLMIVGCGGSGSSSGGSSSGGMQTFLTDDLNAGFDHVWVTIDTIALTGASGSTTIFDATSDGGKVVDLRTLHDASGAKFLLLGGCATPAGTFTGVNVTVSSSLIVVPTGATTGTPATFAGSTGATFVLPLVFGAPQTISASNKVVVDFDLANWNLVGSTVSATNSQFLTQGSAANIGNNGRQCSDDYHGAVSALAGTAPTQTFTISHGQFSVNVVTSASTTIMNQNGSANPTLANGANVEVDGTFDATNNVVDATSITIKGPTLTTRPDRVVGLVTAFDGTAGTVTLQVRGCDGFQPTATSLTLNVVPTTMYFDGSGVTDTEAQFFAALVANTTDVFAEGTISGTTLTVNAIAIATPPPVRQIAIRGVVTNPNATAGTFDVTLADWEGDQLKGAGVIHVVTSSSTVFSNAGSAGTQAGFFAGLNATSQAQVRGTFDPSTMTLTATEVGTGSDDHFHF